MKLMIASDIHGSAFYTEKLTSAFKKENAKRLVLLGDILYHGPRNDLPEGYDPKETARLLNEIKDKILCVRGNCDSEVDQMMLEFPIMADYAFFYLGEKAVYLTHGHKYNDDLALPISEGDILLSGHTHVPGCSEKNGIIYMNPGSVSIPKEMSPSGYMIFDNDKAYWKSFSDGEWMNRGI